MTLYKSRQNSILLPIPRPKTIKTRVKDRHYEQPYYYNMTNHTHISKQTQSKTAVTTDLHLMVVNIFISFIR